MADCALSGPLYLYRPNHFGKELEWIKDRFWNDQDPPELHLAPWLKAESATATFDVTFRLADVLELDRIAFQSYMTQRWQCLFVPGADGLLSFLDVALGNKSEKAQSNYGVLLECLEDKEHVMEDGLENPFIERAKYPLPSTSYILLYAESDMDGNDRICAQLYQSRFDSSIERVLSQLHLFTYEPLDIDYLRMLGFPQDNIFQHEPAHQSKWDTLAARDKDINEKERLRQLERPDFFAKPRPKPVPKKRQTIDLKFLLDRQEVKSSSPKGKRKEQPSTPEQSRKKKVATDTWESENKDMIKKRLWSTMSKERGHDRRSEKSKLLYHQIYQSCQYVFRRVMKDEQVNAGQLDQVIEKHLEFYEQIDKCL